MLEVGHMFVTKSNLAELRERITSHVSSKSNCQSINDLNSILNIPRILGLFPFNERFELRVNSCVYHVIIYFCIITLGLGVLPLEPPDETWQTKSKYWCFTDYMSLVGGLTVGAFWLVLNKDEVAFVASVIQEVDHETQSVVLTHSILPNKIHLYWNAVFIFTSAVIHVTIDIFTSGCIVAFSTLSFSVVSFMNFFLILQLHAFIHVLFPLFSKTLLLSDPSKIPKCHEALCTASSKILNVYGPGVFFTYFNCFYCVVWHLFFAARFSVWAALYTTKNFWIISEVTRILETTRKTTLLKEEASKMNDVVYQRMVKDRTGRLINNEFLDFYLTSWKELDFTACGFFSLDNSLICSMIACGTTYLVILLQFNHSTDDTENDRLLI